MMWTDGQPLLPMMDKRSTICTLVTEAKPILYVVVPCLNSACKILGYMRTEGDNTHCQRTVKQRLPIQERNFGASPKPRARQERSTPLHKKEKQITFWITAEEAAKLKQYADSTGLSQSAYIRRMVLKKPVVLKPSTNHVVIKQQLSALSDELAALAPMIGEAEAIRLRGLVFDAYGQCKEAGSDGV